MPLTAGVTIGFVVSVILLPLSIVILKRFESARLFGAIVLAAAVSGVVLLQYASTDHRVNDGVTVSTLLLLLGMFTSVGAVLWARTVAPFSLVGVSFGVGMLVRVVLDPDVAEGNPWKYAYAIPIAVIVLSALHGRRRIVLQLVVLLILAALSITFDSRSYFGTFMLAALLVGWQLRPQAGRRKTRWGLTALFLGLVAVVLYETATSLLLGGSLGEEAQVRSAAQVEAAGSLILGGRPELGATMALMQDRPFGFGPGVLVTSNELMVAKTGMVALGYDPNNGYVERYMFGSSITLHSMAGDLWAAYGVVGLVLVAFLLVIFIRSLARTVVSGEGGAVLLVLAAWSAWNVFFSPFYTASATTIIALGLCLPLRNALPSNRARSRASDPASIGPPGQPRASATALR
jgi:hypothetical protein